VIKAFQISERFDVQRLSVYPARAYLLDAYHPRQRGGTGRLFDWAIARQAKECGTIILAGGLTPENVRQAIEAVQPYGVDVSSGVERSPGLKDREKIRAFLTAAKGIGR
jgi:phosphoribosylanthranilate isomerase